ncbi:hypothetical protein BHM03_00032853 [Ensete ventricosum]|nr:hypothetical protein BHM03_00032853 [Ensete ventricosum]
MQTARYADRPLSGGTTKIDHRTYRQSIATRIARYRAVSPKSTVGGRLREKKGRRRRRGEDDDIYLLSSHRPRPRAILLPREETERLPAWGERSRRHC